MDFNFYSDVTFTCQELSISRVVRLPFDTKLDQLSYLLYASTMPSEALSKDTFIMHFDEDVFITRVDEQENGFGYSYDSYRVLETEKFINVVLQNPAHASFEILDMKRPNYVFEMVMGDVKKLTDKEKLQLLDGNGMLSIEGKTIACSFKDILSQTKKNLPLVRKIYHFDR